MTKYRITEMHKDGNYRVDLIEAKDNDPSFVLSHSGESIATYASMLDAVDEIAVCRESGRT